MQVKGLAAVVTGGASGLGKATAKALVDAGAKVTVLDVNAEALAASAAEIGALAAPCDVTDVDSVKAALTKGREAHGVARICVNCAGVVHGGRIVGKHGPMDLAGFARTIQINLVGTFNVMSQAVADMMTADPLETGERGVVVNTASVAYTDGQIGQAAYSASKGGVAALTLPAAREFAPSGVRVMCIAPGLFETPMMMGLPEDVYDSLIAKTLFPKRLGKAAEYGDLVLSICQNAMLNGEIIRLDGSLRLEPR